MALRLFKKKEKTEEELPGEFERIRRELHAPRKLPNPEDVTDEEAGEPLVPENQEITIPRRERFMLPPGLEPLTGPAPEREPPRERHGERPRPNDNDDKLDLIMSKLDTIDARLRLIEEKLKRF